MKPLVPSLLFAALAGACFQDSTAKHSDFVPLDYASSFVPVRSCRVVADHGLVYQRVLANALAAAPYTAGTDPLPVGSVVLAEEHDDPNCGHLTGFYLMAKENPGYDQAHGDWHWQRLDANQRVLDDGKLATCASCHARATCHDELCAPP
jgi:hypothetical protein